MNSALIAEMTERAVIARNNSYSPYSKFKVGACISVGNNTFFSGCNLENAAYPAGICAEGAAIAAMVSAGYTAIKELLVVTLHHEVCFPCGICRQMINEFSTEATQVHLCVAEKYSKTLSMAELLPGAFGKSVLLESS